MYIQHATQIPSGVSDNGVDGLSPGFFWGTIAPDGDAEPFISAALGSLYTRKAAGSVVLYLKDEANDADADWAPVTVA
tara:strand:+ start:1886 stop:2119 length:234 start_codon:yes stop_codon:yes gene_type:complete